MKLKNLVALACFLVFFVATTAIAEKTVNFKRKKTFQKKLKTKKDLKTDTTTSPITFAATLATFEPPSKTSIKTKKSKKSRKKSYKKNSKKQVKKITIKVNMKTGNNENSSSIDKKKLNNTEKRDLLSTQTTSTSEITSTVTTLLSVSKISTQSSTTLITNTQSRPPTTPPIKHQNETGNEDKFQKDSGQNYDENPRQEKTNHTTIINEITTNSNNNFTYNINHNNYYLVSGQLDEFLKNFPVPPPYMNLPPPPLPPFVVGCEEEHYQWKVVKQDSKVKSKNSEGGNDEGETRKKCEKKLYDIDDFFDEKKNKAFVESYSEDQKTKEKQESQDFNEADPSQESQDFNEADPSQESQARNETTNIHELLYKLTSVADYNSMRRLGATEGTMVYRTDLKTAFIMTDRWRAIKLDACGNGILEMGEVCDDGNAIDEDNCKNDCSLNICGDGVKSFYEECDGDDFSDTEIFYCRDKAAVKCSKDCKVEC